MARKVYNLTDWTLWQQARLLPLPKDKGRTVRLEVICETATAFRVGTEEQFLDWEEAKREGAFGQLIGVLPHGGQDIIEFFADGNILVEATSDGEVMFFCSENTQWWVNYEDEPSFTKPYERPLVDPAFQAMQLQMMRNMQAMEARIEAGMKARYAVEPPRTPRPETKQEAKPDDGDGDEEAAASAAAAAAAKTGKKPGAGSEKQQKAPAGGGAVQSSASGEGD